MKSLWEWIKHQWKEFWFDKCVLCGKYFDDPGPFLYNSTTLNVRELKRTCPDCGMSAARLNALIMMDAEPKAKRISYEIQPEIRITCECGHSGFWIGRCPNCFQGYIPGDLIREIQKVVNRLKGEFDK